MNATLEAAASSQTSLPAWPVEASGIRTRWSVAARAVAVPLSLAVLTIAVRCGGIDRPLTGVFSTKNVVYAMIARGWAEGRAALWQPSLDCLCDGEPGLHLLEVPVAAYLTGGLWWLFGGSLDAWGRGVSMAASVASVLWLYSLARRWFSESAARAAAVVLALSPVAIIYGQSFMLEASLVAFSIVAIDAFDRYLSTGRIGWLLLFAAAWSLALLTKIYVAVLILVFAAMVYRRWRPARNQCVQASLVFLLASLPAIAWYAYALHISAPSHELSSRVYYSVRQSAESHAFPHPILKQPDFYRQILDDLAGVALTPVGLALVLAGMLSFGRGSRRIDPRLAAWLFASLVLVLLLPRKFYEMSYYWLVVVPPLAILAGIGWQSIALRLQPSRWACGVLIALALTFSARYAVRPAYASSPDEARVLAAASWVRDHTDRNEHVATWHGSTLDLLYYSNRRGWALTDAMLQNVFSDESGNGWQAFIDSGARYLVVVDDNAQRLEERQPRVAELRLVESHSGLRVYALQR